MSTELDNAQAIAAIAATNQDHRLESGQSSALIAASSQINRLNNAQSVVLLVCSYLPPAPTRKRSIVIVAN